MVFHSDCNFKFPQPVLCMNVLLSAKRVSCSRTVASGMQPVQPEIQMQLWIFQHKSVQIPNEKIAYCAHIEMMYKIKETDQSWEISASEW